MIRQLLVYIGLVCMGAVVGAGIGYALGSLFGLAVIGSVACALMGGFVVAILVPASMLSSQIGQKRGEQ